MNKNIHYGINCMDCIDGLKFMESNIIDLTVTSPPYDDLRIYNGYSFDFETIAKELYRVTKKGGVVVWIVSDKTEKGSESLTSFKQILYFKEIGFNIHDTMIWNKPNCFNFGSNLCYKQAFEYMFILSKGKPKSINFIRDIPCQSKVPIREGVSRTKDGKRNPCKNFTLSKLKKRSNVWDINVGGNNYGHPAIFPESLSEDHILSWSNEGDVVMDIFSGSGTTHKMALKNKRKFIGFEISKEYCDIEIQRLKDCGFWCY